jgi:uncharacterized protein YbjQ (UPF0145 family)
MAFTYQKSGFLLTTTPVIEGQQILEYKGLVVGEAIIGANIFRDLLASVRDIVGGRSGAYENALNDTRNIALSEMIDHARELGANAIVGIDLDYETINQMLMVCASGTAVVVQSR